MSLSSSSLYKSDPNQYIKKLSKIKRSIQKQLPVQLKSSDPKIQKQLYKQIQYNFNKYKKTTLLQQRIKLAQNFNKQLEEQKKLNLVYHIDDKIKYSQKIRENIKKINIERIKMQRLTKQVIVKNKKDQIRNQKIKKSLDLIQKLQNNMDNKNQIPVKMRYKSYEKMFGLTNDNNNMGDNNYEDNKNSYNTIKINKRATSNLSLPKISKNFFQQPQENHFQRKLTKQEMLQIMKQSSTKASRAKSLSNLSNASRIKSRTPSGTKKQQLILERIIEQKRLQNYNRFLQRRSIASEASKISRHKQIKQAIQKYLKKHIKKIDITQNQTGKN